MSANSVELLLMFINSIPGYECIASLDGLDILIFKSLEYPATQRIRLADVREDTVEEAIHEAIQAFTDDYRGVACEKIRERQARKNANEPLLK